jgi:hypothetical protein
MADTESLGETGVGFLESLAAAPEVERRVRVPTLTDPRGLDVESYKRLGQTEAMRALEARAIAALRAFGVLMTDTCINYQTIMPPVRGEHLAMGDTGVVIYSNSALARSKEGGAVSLAAADRAHPAPWLSPRRMPPHDPAPRPTRPRDLSGARSAALSASVRLPLGVPLIEGWRNPGPRRAEAFRRRSPAVRSR